MQTKSTPAAPSTSVRDHIARTYLGLVGDEETQVIARARIDWLAAQARGPSVLDIGCSEGVLPLLLARRGIEVTGVDRVRDALAFARDLIGKEPDEVRDRVRLIEGDIFHSQLPEASFDTVVLGEVLEHVEDPAALLGVAIRCLAKAGRLLLTVPVGYLPSADHCQIFSLSSIVELLRPCFTPGVLEVVDGYLRFAGSAGATAGDAWDGVASAPRLLSIVEHSLIESQKRSWERLDKRTAMWQQGLENIERWKAAAEELTEKCRHARDDAKRWRSAAEELAEKRRQALDDAVRWKSAAEELAEKRRQALDDGVRWKTTAEELAEKRRQALDDAVRWKSTAAELAEKHREAVDNAHRSQATAEVLDAERRAALEDARRWRQSAESIESERSLIERRLRGKRGELDRLTKKAGQLGRDARALSARNKELQQELAVTYQSRRYRIGDAMVEAAQGSRSALRLPVRLWRLYREPRGPQSPPAGVTAAEPAHRDVVAERHKRFLQDFGKFVSRVSAGHSSHVVVMFSGTTYIQDIRANRPIRLTQSLAQMGTLVLFNFHRWREADHVPAYDGGLVFQSPVDKTPDLVEQLLHCDLGRARGVLVVSYPHPSVCRLINLVNAGGWATIYDARDDWEAFEKVGMAEWYRPAVERFVVNNCDATCCVSRPLQAKLSGFTATRPVLLLPNAYDPAFLAEGYHRRPGAQVRVGYFGHLTDRWFDWESLAWIIAQRPGYRFEIIGHGAPETLDLPPNASLLGPKTHAEICQIAAKWHAGIIPFRVGPLADGVDPIKIYEYFGLGLPVVSFRMPQIADYPYTTTVDTREAFAEALDRAVKCKCDEKVLADFLEQNTWDTRARQLLRWADEAVDRAPPEKTFHVLAAAGA
ncbi:MAG: methyltransferase domain-containing protein [Phycisphaerae bacterium]|nr:methyltransferase domain-containing protein [Phycisphaerae bacterium]